MNSFFFLCCISILLSIIFLLSPNLELFTTISLERQILDRVAQNSPRLIDLYNDLFPSFTENQDLDKIHIRGFIRYLLSKKYQYLTPSLLNQEGPQWFFPSPSKKTTIPSSPKLVDNRKQWIPLEPNLEGVTNFLQDPKLGNISLLDIDFDTQTSKHNDRQKNNLKNVVPNNSITSRDMDIYATHYLDDSLPFKKSLSWNCQRLTDECQSINWLANR